MNFIAFLRIIFKPTLHLYRIYIIVLYNTILLYNLAYMYDINVTCKYGGFESF